MSNLNQFGFGTWGLAEWGEMNLAQDLDLINFAYEQGVRFFDTAPVYGNGYAERLLSYLPSPAFIATKIPGGENRDTFEMCYPIEQVMSSVENSIRRLNRTISLIQFHNWYGHWELTDYLFSLIASIQLNFGIKNIGVSMPKGIIELTSTVNCLVESELITYFQVKWNIFETQNERFIKRARENRRLVIIRSLFEQGKLLKCEEERSKTRYTDSIQASLSLDPDKILIGMTKRQHVLDLIRTLSGDGH